MSISKSLLPEFDYEMATTRKLLERLPDEKFDWKPHPKSMALGGLATHLANIPTWTINSMTQESLDLAPDGVPVPPMEAATGRDALLQVFDVNVAKAREAIAGAADDAFFVKWSLLMNGRTIMTLPRVGVVRSFVLNHLIHHRGQLSVYLRLNDIPVPSIYGPSADDSSFMA